MWKITGIFLACSVIFGFMAYYYHNRAESYMAQWKNGQANIDYLIQKRREDNEKAILISQRNRELEEEAKNDKSNFDWYFPIGSSPVILRLRKN